MTAADRQAERRRELLAEIAAEMELTADSTGRSALGERVARALAEVPRHEFVPGPEQPYAYYNNALPIGHGQTISQPFIVALMTELLDPAPDHVVLEIGTGSGYQAAVLAKLVRHVYSIEVVPELAASARETLRRLGYGNVTVKAGDGSAGWPEQAPFDGIIVTAAAAETPPALVEQLKPGGRLIIPIGSIPHYQTLTLLTKSPAGEVREEPVLAVAFVPLVSAPAEPAG
jgi:protein-L-isoaspartate(D-aspartate) O-methyltransferase